MQSAADGKRLPEVRVGKSTNF